MKWGGFTSPVARVRTWTAQKEEDMSMKIRGFVALAGIAACAMAASASSYAIDDGVAEDSIGLNATTYDSVWLNTFSLTGGDTVINNISISFGSANTTNLVGTAATILLYSDPTGGTPWDSTLVYSAPVTITANNAFINFAVPNVAVSTNFVVGFRYLESRTTGSFPAGFDQTTPTLANRSYAGFQVPSTNPINLSNLSTITAGQFNTIEAFGLVGNFLIRADGAVPAPGAAGLLGLAGIAGLRRRR